MVDFVLNVVPKGISGYKWFDFDIKTQGAVATEPTQGAVATESTQGVVATEPVTWKWRLDCHKQGGDQCRDATEVVTHKMAFDSERKMDVTYLVMSDTVKAKVEVKLRLGGAIDLFRRRVTAISDDRESKFTVDGEIAAHIDGFDHRIVLFRINDKSKPKVMARGPTLPLDRSAVWVPRDKQVDIEMKQLHVRYGDTEVVSIPDRCLSFKFGELSPYSGGNDSEVEVNISWDGIPQESTVKLKPDDNDKVEWIVGDDAQAFTKFIVELRDKVATRSKGHVLEGYKRKDLKGISNRSILAKQGDKFIEAERCVHIELQAELDAETWSTTLAVRDDECSGVGFMNQSEVWYDLGYLWGHGWREEILPAKYNSVFLGWGVGYNQILQGRDWREQLNKEAKKFTTKDFVKNAVRTLSRYPDVEEEGMNPRIAVVTLMIVTCESAKLDLLHKSFEGAWGTDEVEFITDEMRKYVLAWEEMSRTLLHWKYHFYGKWPQSSEKLKEINITSQRRALLQAIHLVLNRRRALPDQIDVTYTIDDEEEGYTTFITELRRIVTGTRTGVVLPRRPGDRHGSIWWNIQLKVAGKETSVTLALRGHDLRISGFRGRDNNWYQLDVSETEAATMTMFKQEYDASAIVIQMPPDPKYWYATYGKTAAIEAVVKLSKYPDPILFPSYSSYKGYIGDEDGTDGLVLPLMNLHLMVSYSASIRKVHNAVEQDWRRLEGTIAALELLELMSFWDDVSISALELWEHCGDEAVQQGWLMDGRAADRKPMDGHMKLSWKGDTLRELLERIGIRSSQGAREVFALIKEE